MALLSGTLFVVLALSWKRSRGFNLLEVVIASFIFSVSTIAFLGVWGMQARSIEKSRHKLVATLLAESLVEAVMQEGYEATAVSTLPVDIEELPMETEIKDPQGNWHTTTVIYEYTTTVTEIGGDDDRLKKVDISVTWEDSTKNGEVKLVTYLAGVF